MHNTACLRLLQWC